MSTTLNTQQAALGRMLRAIAQATDFKELVGQLTQIMLCASGAQRCLLVLPESQQWFVWAMAQATCSNCLRVDALPNTAPNLKLCSQRLEQCPHLPSQLMQLAQQQQRSLGLMEAAQATTFDDPYLRQHQPQSLLCQPVIVQGQTIALWYWEHASQAGVFSADTVSELEILATQAAIAIDRVRLQQLSPTAPGDQPHRQVQTAEQHLQQLAENFPGVLYQFRLDSDGSQQFPFVSAGSRTLYELEPEEMLQAFELVHPDYIEAFQQAIATSAQTLNRFYHEHPITTPSGEPKWIRVVANPTQQANGAILWDGVILDITQSKRTELQLRLSEQRFRNIFHNLPMVAMQIYDRKRRLVDWNNASTTIYGYSREEALGQQLEDLIIPSEMRQPVIEAVDAWVQGGPAIPPAELSLLHKDGSRVSVYSTHFLLPNTQGEPEMYCLDIDLRDRQRAEAALQRSKQLLESVINTLPGAMWWKDHQLVFQGANEYLSQILGLETPGDIVGKTDADILESETEITQSSRSDRRIIASGNPELGVIEARQQVDGTQVWLETSKVPLLDEAGDVMGLVGMFQDVTQREQATIALRQKTQELEQALHDLQSAQLQLVQTEKMSSLGQMVAGIAHEINNPVTFIYGNIDHAVTYVDDLFGLIEQYRQVYPDPPLVIQDWIEDIDLDFLQQDFQELIQSMRVGTERIKAIVNSLRNFSRLDEAAVKAVDLHEGIDSTLTILQTRLRAQDWRPEIQVRKDYGELPRIKCYAGQLNQVFMNIISNSIDALEERDRAHSLDQKIQAAPSQIRITTRTQSQVVELKIQDNGPGMDAATRDRLFDPFFTTKPVGQGTGLGLSISYQIIAETHGGSLSCTSEPGAGATFVITLPLTTANDASGIAQSG
ncbi:MAG: PAS domain S-box protein, partial [Spirulina sp. SIO3F2]|nr:PAS domain S-box protein [Spirulina sp. SIO3F2]